MSEMMGEVWRAIKAAVREERAERGRQNLAALKKLRDAHVLHFYTLGSGVRIIVPTDNTQYVTRQIIVDFWPSTERWRAPGSSSERAQDGWNAMMAHLGLPNHQRVEEHNG